METEKINIINDNEEVIVGEIFRPKKRGRLPCIIFSHGLLEDKKSAYIRNFTQKLVNEGYVVVAFDSTRSLGESDGDVEYVTISQKIIDLLLVIEYVKRRSFIDDSRVVVFGHCYGAMTALAMEGFEHCLAGLVLVSTPASIESTLVTRKSSHEMMKVRLKRYFHTRHEEQELRINYSFYEDGSKLDMNRAARNLDTPVLFIHGVDDVSIPISDSEGLFTRAIGPKRFEKIKMGHEIKGPAVTKVYSLLEEFLTEHL